MKRVFIVRPFSEREGIDFKDVQKRLIAPALRSLGDFDGGTTELFLKAGNIRLDMFQQLLTADLVIADISVQNANVFYELGVRHALCAKHTFLIRAKSITPVGERIPQNEVPFDIRTDRYLEYDRSKPEAALESLKDGIRQTLESQGSPDSPVFMMIPDLEAQNKSRFVPVPQGFREEVELAASELGRLGLLALESRRFHWESEGLRLVGRAQFELKNGIQSRAIWERLLEYDPADIEANKKLGMINQRLAFRLARHSEAREGSLMTARETNDKYRLLSVDINQDDGAVQERPNPERLKYLAASNQALQKVVDSLLATSLDRADALSLQGLNIQDEWISEWKKSEDPKSKALESPHLMDAYDKFRQAFQEDLNSFTPGLNALVLLTLTTELIKQLPDVWEGRFNNEDKAEDERIRLEQEQEDLMGAVKNAIEASRKRADKRGKKDPLSELAKSDLQFLEPTNPKSLAFSFAKAMVGAPSFRMNESRERLETFRDLGVFEAKAKGALERFPKAPPDLPLADRVVVFAGTDFDRQDLTESAQQWIRDQIRDKLVAESGRTSGNVVAIAGASSAYDLIFHEICESLAIPHNPYLPLPPDRVRGSSITKLGPEWGKRFDSLMKASPPIQRLADSSELPKWLRAQLVALNETEEQSIFEAESGRAKYSMKGYDIWKRASLWRLFEAVAVGADGLTLIVVSDGVKTRMLGDLEHLRAVVADEPNSIELPILTTDRPKAEAFTA